MVNRIEEWLSKYEGEEGKAALIKLLLPEPDEPEFNYQIRVEGTRYGQLAIVERPAGHFVVVHVRSGRLIGSPTPLKRAVRLTHLLRKLVAWQKVDWTSNEDYQRSSYRHLCKEACDYVYRGVDDCPRLLKAIEEASPSEEKQREEVIVEAKASTFGTVEVPPPQAPPAKGGGWGITITK
jgi:hypothetical protein